MIYESNIDLYLIISIATMMITFCASLFIILKGKSMIIPVIGLASVLVALFAWMQLHLLIDMIILTYRLGKVQLDAKFEPSHHRCKHINK